METIRYPKIRLKSGREQIVRNGHPWIFSGAIQSNDSDLQPGDVAQAVSQSGRAIATGFYHPKSDIAFRILTRDAGQPIDAGFWEDRIRTAAELRKQLITKSTNAFRLINAEGDGLPGLIVDRYDKILVVSIQTLGMERFRDQVIDSLIKIAEPEFIYERSDSRSRRLEGLDSQYGWIGNSPSTNTAVITEKGLQFLVNIVEGQKTGFFLDQRDNRHLVEQLSQGRNVLNCFSYTGGFSVYAARGDAKSTVSVEASQSANQLASENFEINGFTTENHRFISADVFKYLRETTERHSLIILDPPAFCKSSREISRASRGYKEINLQAIRLLNPGGLLFTFSCSNHIDPDLFRKIVMSAASDSGKRIRLLQTLGPGMDHPTMLAHPEGSYLKGLLLSVEND